MLPPKEIIKFLKRRYKSDPLDIFIWRLLRLCFIAPFTLYESIHFKILKKLLGKNSPFVIKLIQGSYMLLDSNDKGISRDLICDSVREPYLTNMVRANIKFGETVFDIGANIGYYALIIAHKVGEDGKVYAIEPVGTNRKLLIHNIKLNQEMNPFPQRYNIEPLSYAVGSCLDVVDMNISRMRNLCSINQVRDVAYTEKVTMISLDALIKLLKVFPDSIRMDVEGYEYEIIQGAKDLLNSNKPLKIFMELHCDMLLDKQVVMCKLLKDSGFEVKYAAFEPHPCVQRHKWALPVLKFLDNKLGFAGIRDISIDDLINNKHYINGDVEYLEVLFVRE